MIFNILASVNSILKILSSLTSMRVTKVGQRFNVLSVREQTGMHCLEIILGQVYQSGKGISCWDFFFLI